MTLAQRAIFRVLLVALATVIALILAAPVSRQELSPLVTTPSTTQPVIAHIEETP